MGVRAIMTKYDLEYEDIDIINSQENYAEMVTKSGQPLSPCVEIDGIMQADVSGEEVEAYMLSNNLVGDSAKKSWIPNRPRLLGRRARTHARRAIAARSLFLIKIKHFEHSNSSEGRIDHPAFVIFWRRQSTTISNHFINYEFHYSISSL